MHENKKFTLFIAIVGMIIGAIITSRFMIKKNKHKKKNNSEALPYIPIDIENIEKISITSTYVIEQQDDLKKIEGIGPVIEKILQKHNITTYSTLSKQTQETLQNILRKENIRLANPATWAEQAALAANKNWDDLGNFQKKLKGGVKHY
ncbi:MAG: hypothetical protein CVU39_16955 [Chloroflexi bacterium HGW-Chloroflexi-10]|nr:MAG: hypothetical protein CVU39_16955 [Chloroflexi bacterium HGW-Chloroflexi-10]